MKFSLALHWVVFILSESVAAEWTWLRGNAHQKTEVLSTEAVSNGEDRRVKTVRNSDRLRNLKHEGHRIGTSDVIAN